MELRLFQNSIVFCGRLTCHVANEKINQCLVKSSLQRNIVTVHRSKVLKCGIINLIKRKTIQVRDYRGGNTSSMKTDRNRC